MPIPPTASTPTYGSASGYQDLKKERSAEGYKRQISNVVIERFTASSQTYQQLLLRTARRYDMYRGFYQGRYHSFRNNVHIPLTFSVIQSDVAHKVQTSFGIWPIVEMEGYGPEDVAVARKNTVLLSAQMKDDDSFRKAVDFFTSADVYGTAILQHGWKFSQQPRVFRETVQNVYTRQTREMVRKQMVTDFDGPHWEVVDILDFFPEPGVKRVNEMRWCIRRLWMDYDDLRALGRQGVYDLSEIDSLKKQNGPAGRFSGWLGYQDRIRLFRSQMDENTRSGTDRTDRPVEILEMWGELPDELIPPDGAKSRVITVANGTALLRNEPNPYWHGQLPFLHYSPVPDPHYFYGIGKVEISEKLQAAANRFTNQKLDALDLFVDPVFVYDRNRAMDGRNLYMRAGRQIGIDGPVGEDAVRTISPDLRGLQHADVEIEQLWRWIQQGTGQIEDTTMGTAGTSKRQTASEFQGRQQQISTRLLLETRLAEEGFVEPLANAFRMLNKQYLSTPKELRIAGQHAVINPMTGEQLPMEERKIELSDLYPDYDVRAKGATQMASRATQQQNLSMLIQMIGGNPAAAVWVNWVALLRQTFQTFEFMNMDEMLNTPEDMRAQNAQALGVGGDQAQQGPPGAMAPQPQIGGGF